MNRPPTFVIVYFHLIAGVTAGIGFTLLLWPEVMNLFFNNLTTATLFMARVAGCTLIGYATLNGLTARRIRDPQLLNVAVLANLTTLLATTLLCIVERRVIDEYAWLLIAEHAVFSTGFLYCLFALKHQSPVN